MNTADLVVDVACVPANNPWLFLPDCLWMTRFKLSVQIDVRWLAYLLSSRACQQQIKVAATGTSGSIKNISKDSSPRTWGTLDISAGHPQDGFDGQTVVRCGMTRIARLARLPSVHIDRHANTQISRM